MQCVALLCSVLLVSCAHWSAAMAAGPQVTTKQGTVQGVSRFMSQGHQIDVFEGIPYAAPPVGALRFQPPQPAAPWTGVKDVSRHNIHCVQRSNADPRESEDCLYLNLERPHGANKLPVMFYIHGGGYVVGGKDFNGNNLAAKGVVVVSINYRLGPLGFLSTQDSAIPGNYGILDQIQALKWVQENIAAFGGDPASVTIFGESAGSASVSLLLLSPRASGLFHKAVMMSGVASTSRDVAPPKMPVPPKTVAATAGAALGCDVTRGDFLACLQGKDVHTLFKACADAAHASHVSTKWFPSVETVYGVLPDYPLRLIERGEFMKIPTIRGFNAQENGHMMDREHDGFTREEFLREAGKRLDDMPYLDTAVYQEKIVDLYIGNVTDKLEIRARTIEMSSDLTFILATVLEAQNAKMHNAQQKSFLYDFNYMSPHSRNEAWQGVTHGANMMFVTGSVNPHVNDTDAKVASMMMTMWTNFAKFGNPTPAGHSPAPLLHWTPLYRNHLNYLEIRDVLEMKVFNSSRQQQKLELYRDTMAQYQAAAAPVSLQPVG